MAYYPIQGSSRDLIEGKVVVLPSVSLANLPQLAADLLIHSLNMVLVGYIGTGSTVAPLVGTSRSGLVTGGLEVYSRDGLDFVVVQQRSPNSKTKKEEHVALLQSFVDETKPAFVLLLTSLDAANQDDDSLMTPHTSILPPTAASSPLVQALQQIPSLQIDSYPPFIPSGGLSRRILSSFQKHSTPHGGIGAWCVEGDNREDAHALAYTTLSVLGKNDVELKAPKEWDGLFGVVDGWSGGTGADSELYG